MAKSHSLTRKKVLKTLRRANKLSLRGDVQQALELKERVSYTLNSSVSIIQKINDLKHEKKAIIQNPSIGEIKANCHKDVKSIESNSQRSSDVKHDEKKIAPKPSSEEIKAAIEEVRADYEREVKGVVVDSEENFNKVFAAGMKLIFQVLEKHLRTHIATDLEVSKEGEALFYAQKGFREMAEKVYKALKPLFGLNYFYAPFQLLKERDTINDIANQYEAEFNTIARANLLTAGNISDIFTQEFNLIVQSFRATIQHSLDDNLDVPGCYSKRTRALLFERERYPSIEDALYVIFARLLQTDTYSSHATLLLSMREQLIRPIESDITNKLRNIAFSR